MLRRNVPHNVLLAPDAVAGGGGPGAAISGWISKLQSDEGGGGGAGAAGSGGGGGGAGDGKGQMAEGQGQKAKEEASGGAAAAAKESAAAEGADGAAGAKAAGAQAGAQDKAQDKAKGQDWDKTPPRSAEQWKKAKADIVAPFEQQIAEREAKLKEAQTQLESLNAELAKAKEGGADKAVLERMQKENERLSEELRTANVERHPKFKAYFENKVNAQVGLAKSIVGADKAAEAEKLLAMPESEYRQQKIDEFVAELSPLQQSRFGAVLNALEGIGQERAEAIKTEVERAAKLAADNDTATKTRQAEARKQMDAAFASALKGLQGAENGNPAYQLREGDEAWNKGVEARVARAKRILTGEGLKPQDIIAETFNAAAYPAVLEQAKALLEENASLKAQVEKLTKARPGLPASGAEGGGSGKADGIKPGTPPSSARERWMATLQQG